MLNTIFTRKPWLGYLVALISGAALTVAFAPFEFWPLTILAPALLIVIAGSLPGYRSVLAVYCFALGNYATGISWIYVSINTFGNASPVLAGTLMFLFSLFMAAMFTSPFFFYPRWLAGKRWSVWLALPLLLLLSEWVRTWMFTGFPWLFLGYAHINTWLAGWAPILGVMGISLICFFTAASAVIAVSERSRRAVSFFLATLLLWPAGLALQQIEWTKTVGEPIKVGIVQANIAQEDKWASNFLRPTINRYRDMTNSLWENDWIIWPEAAIPLRHSDAKPLLDDFSELAKKNNSALITGMLYDDWEKRALYNSVLGLGEGSGTYFKQRLVPFGEYVPLEDWIRGLIDFFNLPNSFIRTGPAGQAGLRVGEHRIAPFICYEVVYPDFVARNSVDSNVLLTISNDSWFGTSIGPLQHMEIAQMRALETGRALIRGTNNGISALVNERGYITKTIPQFQQATLSGEVQLREGSTPFMIWRSYPLLVLAFGLLLWVGLRKNTVNDETGA